MLTSQFQPDFKHNNFISAHLQQEYRYCSLGQNFRQTVLARFYYTAFRILLVKLRSYTYVLQFWSQFQQPQLHLGFKYCSFGRNFIGDFLKIFKYYSLVHNFSSCFLSRYSVVQYWSNFLQQIFIQILNTALLFRILTAEIHSDLYVFLDLIFKRLVFVLF